MRERVLVDRDDGDGLRGALEGKDALVAIEDGVAQPFEARRVGDG
jgi:hypothetical protein